MPSGINLNALSTDEVLDLAGAALSALNGRFEEEEDDETRDALTAACDAFDRASALYQGDDS